MSRVSRPPRHAAWLQEAVGHHRAGRLGEAAALYAKVLKRDGNDVDALYLLGTVRHQTGDRIGAVRALEKAIKLAPDHAESLHNLGKVWADADDLAKAEDLFRRALAAKDDYPAAHANLGMVLVRLGWPSEALASLERAVALDPASVRAWSDLGAARSQTGDAEGAVHALATAIGLDGENAAAHMNLAHVLLAAREFERGLTEFDWRLKADPGAAPPFLADVPRWEGGSLAGRHILLLGEQGLGDQILYSGQIPRAAKQAGRVTLAVDSRLVPLFRRSFPDVAVIALGDIPANTPDLQAPLGDLLRGFRPDQAAFSGAQPDLTADIDRASALREAYRARLGADRLIGIAWKSTRAGVGALKSTDLVRDWPPLLSLPGAAFINLQYGDVTDDLARAAAAGFPVFADPEIDATGDLDSLAAQIAALDVVISPSNTTVHLAAALRVPTLTLVPAGAGQSWYWFKDGVESPWYPAMQLIRQDVAGDWSSAIARAVQILDS